MMTYYSNLMSAYIYKERNSQSFVIKPYPVAKSIPPPNIPAVAMREPIKRCVTPLNIIDKIEYNKNI